MRVAFDKKILKRITIHMVYSFNRVDGEQWRGNLNGIIEFSGVISDKSG